jgi:hypothetical protein
MRMFRREHVEDAVWTYVEEQLLDPDCLEEGIRNMGKHTEHEQDRLRTQLNDLRRQLENTKLQQDRLVSLFLSGIYSEEELSVHKKQLDHSRTSIEAGIAETEHQLAGLAATEEEILVLRDFAGQIIQGLDRTKMEHKKKLLKILGVRVEMAIEESQKILFVRSHLSPEAVARVLVISPNLHSW